MSRDSQAHGSMRSYVVGFILSLIFTILPYSMVVNGSLHGLTLTTVVLGFGMIQMIIQITFFLHLGRGPKPRWNLFFFIATFGLILVVVGGSILIIHNLHYNMSPADQVKRLANDEGIYQVGGQPTGACQKLGINHKVVIKDGAVSPLHTDAGKCDTLTFINQDSAEREMSFGEHPAHEVYAGVTELLVRKGVNKTVTLSETGTYKFHDHLQEETAGDFTVAE